MSAPNMPRMMAAGAIGNMLEWYDFAVYGYFATSIGRVFFPEQDKVAQVLAAFGVFAVGFMMRPVGGALFGHIGDRLGRRIALTLSVAAMAVPTFLIGTLPGYDVLGLAAPVLLTLLRMIQGLSVGGEYTTSIVFLVEGARPEHRGVVGAVADLGAVTEHAEGHQHLRHLVLLGEEHAADRRGELAVDGEIVPFEHVADGAGGDDPA